MNVGLIRDIMGMAGRALAANRLRSMLALLGIVIGVGTVIGMMALINGFQRSFERSIQSLGNNTIYIRRIRPGIQFSGWRAGEPEGPQGVHHGRRGGDPGRSARGHARSRRSSGRSRTCGSTTTATTRRSRSCSAPTRTS
jgi:hypothetical protein